MSKSTKNIRTSWECVEIKPHGIVKVWFTADTQIEARAYWNVCKRHCPQGRGASMVSHGRAYGVRRRVVIDQIFPVVVIGEPA